MIGREYIPAGFLMVLTSSVFIWFQFFELPRMKREHDEEQRNSPTAAPESHSKSSE